MQGKKCAGKTDSGSEISAGCGLSWCADLTDREQILDVMKDVGIEQEDVHECLV